MKILIVDDETVSRTKLKMILETVGECHEAENGREALAFFKRAWAELIPFDLVCLDVSMPGMDGTEVLLEIREAESQMRVSREKPVKILMITSHADKDTVITSIQAGCDDYLVKPFQPGHVLDKIKKLGFKTG